MVLSRRLGSNIEGAEIASTNNYLSSMAGRVLQANINESVAAANGGKLWGVWAAIFLTWAVVHSLAYVIVQYGFFRGTKQYYLGDGTSPYYFVPRSLSPAASCAAGLAKSGFSIHDPHVEKWLSDSTVLELAETGIWTGAAEIAEYVKFPFHKEFFEYLYSTSPKEVTPV